MRAIHSRLHRLEDQLAGAYGKPPETYRLVIRRLDQVASLENAACTRKLWPNGTVFEMVRFMGERKGGREAIVEGLDRWVAASQSRHRNARHCGVSDLPIK